MKEMVVKSFYNLIGLQPCLNNTQLERKIYSDLDCWKKGDDNMNVKMKRDLVKLLFEKEFTSYDLKSMYEYKGRVIADYVHRTEKLIDFIDKIKDEYGIKGNEVADIIIKEFELKEYKQG